MRKMFAVDPAVKFIVSDASALVVDKAQINYDSTHNNGSHIAGLKSKFFKKAGSNTTTQKQVVAADDVSFACFKEACNVSLSPIKDDGSTCHNSNSSVTPKSSLFKPT